MGMKKSVVVDRPRDARGRLLPKVPRTYGKTLMEVFAEEPPLVEVVVPVDATCVAASPQSGHRYFPCGAPAVAINESVDHVRGTRCLAHAIVGVKELGERIQVTTHPMLLALREVVPCR